MTAKKRSDAAEKALKATVKKLRAELDRADAKAKRLKSKAARIKSASTGLEAKVKKLKKRNKRLNQAARRVADVPSPVAASTTGDPSPTVSAQPAGSPDASWTVVQLRAEARSRGLTGVSGMTKAQLLAALG